MTRTDHRLIFYAIQTPVWTIAMFLTDGRTQLGTAAVAVISLVLWSITLTTTKDPS